MSNQCLSCGYCVENCDRCPQGCEFLTIFNLNKKRINRRVRLNASLQLFQKKGATVSRMVGQGATPNHLLQAGGPGDLISSVEQSAPRATRAARKSVRYNKGFSLGTSKNRLSCKGSVGVDKKHGSYVRYLARKTGGVLRKEQMPRVKQRKASIHQPRNRSGTGVPCCRRSHTLTTQRLKVTDVGPIVAECDPTHCDPRYQTLTTTQDSPTNIYIGDYVTQGTTNAAAGTVTYTTNDPPRTFIVKLPCDSEPFTDTEGQSPWYIAGRGSISQGTAGAVGGKCCQTRIPQINTATCRLHVPDAARWNSGNSAITGACGNNTQCVSSTRCRCCFNSHA